MNQVQGLDACLKKKAFSRGLAKRSGREDLGRLPGFTLKALAATGTIHLHGITYYKKGAPSAHYQWTICASMTCSLQYTRPLCVLKKQNTEEKAQAKQTTAIYISLVQITQPYTTYTMLRKKAPILACSCDDGVFSGLQLQSSCIFGELLCSHPHCGPGNFALPLYFHIGMI